jgi:hypothetical protein
MLSRVVQHLCSYLNHFNNNDNFDQAWGSRCVRRVSSHLYGFSFIIFIFILLIHFLNLGWATTTTTNGHLNASINQNNLHFTSTCPTIPKVTLTHPLTRVGAVGTATTMTTIQFQVGSPCPNTCLAISPASPRTQTMVFHGLGFRYLFFCNRYASMSF